MLPRCPQTRRKPGIRQGVQAPGFKLGVISEQGIPKRASVNLEHLVAAVTQDFPYLIGAPSIQRFERRAVDNQTSRTEVFDKSGRWGEKVGQRLYQFVGRLGFAKNWPVRASRSRTCSNCRHLICGNHLATFQRQQHRIVPDLSLYNATVGRYRVFGQQLIIPVAFQSC